MCEMQSYGFKVLFFSGHLFLFLVWCEMFTALSNSMSRKLNQFLDFISPIGQGCRLSIQLDINNSCNLACEHCYHSDHKNNFALQYNDWLNVIDKYEKLLNVLVMKPNIIICGGEPLLFKELDKLLIHLRRKFHECDITILSNGTLLEEDRAKLFKSLNIELQMSVDGPDSARHDSIRGINSFNRTLNGCEILIKHDVRFFHLAVLSKRTADWIEDFFALPKLTGAQSMNFTRLISQGFAQNLIGSGRDRALSNLELKAAYLKIYECSKKHNISTSTKGPLWCLIDESLGSYCNIGINGFVISYKGDVKLSSRIDYSIGNVLKDDLTDLFLHNNVMNELRVGKIDVCGSCKYFDKCRGDRNASFVTHGHFLGSDPGCWLVN